MATERAKHVTPFSLGPQRRGQVMPPISSMPQAAHQAHSTGADLATLTADFNALLDKLIAANLMAP